MPAEHRHADGGLAQGYGVDCWRCGEHVCGVNMLGMGTCKACGALQPKSAHEREEAQQRVARDSTLRCVSCGKLTTRIEAEQRVLRRGSCGHCGGVLIEATLCGEVSPKTRAICFAERGHKGAHRATEEWT